LNELAVCSQKKLLGIGKYAEAANNGGITWSTLTGKRSAE